MITPRPLNGEKFVREFLPIQGAGGYLNNTCRKQVGEDTDPGENVCHPPVGTRSKETYTFTCSCKYATIFANARERWLIVRFWSGVISPNV